MRLTWIPFITALALSACSSTGGSSTSQDDVTPSGDATDGTPGDDAVSGGDSTGSDATDGGTDGTDGTGPQPDEIVACGALTPATPPGADGCSVEKGSAALLISGDILAPNAVYTGGSVLLDATGQIQCVGCDCAAQAGDATKVICPDAVVSPGLINTHDHIGWMNDKPWVATENDVDPALRWEQRHDWRKGKRGNPKISTGSGGANADEKSFGELRFALGGATGLFGSGDLTGIVRDLDKTGSVDSGLGRPGAEYNTFPLSDSGGTQKASGCDYGKLADQVTKAPSGAFVPHVSEGIDAEARNEFLCLTGQGDNSADALGDKTFIIHGVGLDATDAALMASKGIGLVWSPRSNVSLYGETARVTAMARVGVKIALGSDWIPSGSMNMLRELACADYLNTHHYGGYFTDAQLWMMATQNAADALGVGDIVGSLTKGFVGDIAVFAKSGRSAHRAVLGASVGDTVLVLRGGKPVVGNAAVIDALETGCDSLGDVCGHDKHACLQRDIGKTWSQLSSGLGSPAYPLFFCDVPANEPSCVPARTMAADAVNGSNNYGASMADDQDGDGIADATDNCPTIFNPTRPLDDGKQADVDADNVGDECDPCPIDAASTTCSTFDASDPDKDGVSGPLDNCPKIANGDQADADSDGKGDLCDDCKDYANPGTAGCLASPVDVKTIAEFQGKTVALENLVVIAVGANGFFCQENKTPAVQHSGLFVFTGAAPTQKIGDVFAITGATVSDFFGQTQLTGATFGATQAGAEPAPVVLSASDVAAQVTAAQAAGYESMLVTVENVTVTNAAPTGGAGDTTATNEFEVTGGLRVDDAIWPAGTTFVDPKPANGDTFGSITGVLAWRNGLVKLLPRTAADIVYGAAKIKLLDPATGAFQFEGETGPTFPSSLRAVLTNASTDDIVVTLSSDDTAIAKLTTSTVTISAGSTSIEIPVEGVAAGTATISATYDGKTVTADVTVLDTTIPPKPVSIDPLNASPVVGGEQVFTVTLNVPAGPTGAVLAVTVDKAAGTGPSTVNVPAKAISASFTITAASAPGTGDVFVSTGGGSVAATVTVVEVSSATIDLSKYVVKQEGAALSLTIPDGTTLGGGGYLIISRNADKAAFETKWAVTLADNVVFLNGKTVSGKEFPSINGDETFTLVDASGATVDGPTVALATAKGIYARTMPVGPAGDATSWSNGAATPGSGQSVPATPNGVYISEFADSSGTGNFIYEYVELHFDGPKP